MPLRPLCKRRRSRLKRSYERAIKTAAPERSHHGMMFAPASASAFASVPEVYTPKLLLPTEIVRSPLKAKAQTLLIRVQAPVLPAILHSV